MGTSWWLWTLYNGIYNLSTLRPKQNDRHFEDHISKFILLNENMRILSQISMPFVTNSQSNNMLSVGAD